MSQVSLQEAQTHYSRVTVVFELLPKTSPVFDDTEVKAREVPADEGQQGTDDPACVKFTVGVGHLQRKHTHKQNSTQVIRLQKMLQSDRILSESYVSS